MPRTFLSPLDSVPTSGSSPHIYLSPIYNPHTLPFRRPGQHLFRREPSACLYCASLSEPVLPLPPLIDVLVTSTRETAPKQSARPLAHDDTLRPLDHPSASPRCLLSTALRRRSLRSLLQLRGPMRRLHNGYVNVAFQSYILLRPSHRPEESLCVPGHGYLPTLPSLTSLVSDYYDPAIGLLS